LADTKESAFTAGTPALGQTFTFLNGTPLNRLATFANGIGMADMLGTLTASEVAVTGAVTATISKWHVCTGTSADYTVTLPAASGNTGKFIGFRMGSASALTKMVTLDGNASETIDGALTRIMWAYETCVLKCDGSNWHKVAGRSIPMSAEMVRNTAQSITTATVTQVLLNNIIFDMSGQLADTTNNRINIKRPANYSTAVSWSLNAALTTAQLVQARTHAGTPGSTTERKTALVGGTGGPTPAYLPYIGAVLALVAGDCVEFHVYQTSGGSVNTVTTSGAWPVLTVVENPEW
jgi:hypothetical protein